MKPASPFLLLIAIWQKGISPYIGHHCRFEPTCSEYGRQALIRYGLLKGGYLLIRRLLKCHPLNPGGYDPVAGEENPITVLPKEDSRGKQ